MWHICFPKFINGYLLRKHFKTLRSIIYSGFALFMSITLEKINERNGLSTSVGHRVHSSSSTVETVSGVFLVEGGGHSAGTETGRRTMSSSDYGAESSAYGVCGRHHGVCRQVLWYLSGTVNFTPRHFQIFLDNTKRFVGPIGIFIG